MGGRSRRVEAGSLTRTVRRISAGLDRTATTGGDALEAQVKRPLSLQPFRGRGRRRRTFGRPSTWLLRRLRVGLRLRRGLGCALRRRSRTRGGALCLSLGRSVVRDSVFDTLHDIHFELGPCSVHPHALLVVEGDEGLEQAYGVLDGVEPRGRRGRGRGEQESGGGVGILVVGVDGVGRRCGRRLGKERRRACVLTREHPPCLPCARPTASFSSGLPTPKRGVDSSPLQQ